MDINQLRNKYREHKKGTLSGLYDNYIAKRENAILDSITTSLAVNSLFTADEIDFSAITPKMEQAFNLSFPNLEIEELSNMTESQLIGISQGWKGKLFELEVLDKLNRGENVGGIFLETDQYAKLADVPNQAGWDLQILNLDGSVANELQLKATESVGYIKEALSRYPDIDVISTSEGFVDVASNYIDSGITNESLKASIAEPMTELFDSTSEDIIENIFPGLPFLVIATLEGRKCFIGKQSYEEGVNNMIRRGIKSGVALGIGSLAFYLTDMGIVSIPATILSRWMMNKVDEHSLQTDLVNNIDNNHRKLEKVYLAYKC